MESAGVLPAGTIIWHHFFYNSDQSEVYSAIF